MQTANAHLPTESSTFTARTAAAYREQDAATHAAEQADIATRAARQAIKSINCLGEREVCALIAELTRAIASSGWSHTEGAIGSADYLTSAHAVLEEQAERDE
jgi:ABC-type branched-subunit amino acid transport system substrate-binding protein